MATQEAKNKAVDKLVDAHSFPIPNAFIDRQIEMQLDRQLRELAAQGVDAAAGLTSAEVESRRAKFGPNKFAEAPKEPRWRAFLRQYADPMQIVLLAACIGSMVPLKQWGTGILLILLTLLNAALGLHQEGRAAAAIGALQKMMIVKAKVRRGGELVEVPAEQLVPGDVVSIEAGDIVPADGRLLQAATLEIAVPPALLPSTR